MRIVIIGSGNVATVLGRKLKLAGQDIIQVYGRSEQAVAALAKELGCERTTDIESLNTNGDLYLLCISDSALYLVHEWLRLDKQLVAHTAGSVPMTIFENVSENYGVLYPLQSLRKEMEIIPEIPFLVNGNNIETISQIESLAKQLSPITRIVSDADREKLHVASVITNNFTNHLYALAQNFCSSEKIDFDLLLPIINEMGKRLILGPAINYQTGPAFRNDQVTIEHHLALLKEYPQLSIVYNALSESIKQLHFKK